jgi:hypothetical protein
MDPLFTARLLLRPFVGADATARASLIEGSREHLAPWIPLPKAGADLTAPIAELARRFQSGDKLTSAVVAEDRLVGLVSLTKRGADRELVFSKSSNSAFLRAIGQD